ncbi:GntR family transcriptional regulator [Lutibaculum baratangense]|uniref:Putative regulator PutR for proline utilization, GntR family n=1 Tax=Lutibaculum baratangense AMV1 TaxID=631454 RepID=V4TBG8_9HYPH|nr:GntR family transcriptional regulator [Lutibaculum baratangense]ESR23743.1 putative regulator PutR for proline utilization, GntR family [Lutibaculum baratangense AMV1]
MDNALKVERPTVTLRELALNKLRDAILERRFRPGERLVERKLCELLGVSRTVVREVLRHLEAEGLVEILPHHGPIVARLDLETVEQIYEMRMVIEVMVVRSCAERIGAADVDLLRVHLDEIRAGFAASDIRRVMRGTSAFYEVLFTAAGKTVAWDVFRNLNARINQLRSYTLWSPGRNVTGPGEMQAMLDAIGAHDPDAAEAACRLHVGNAWAIARQSAAASE